MPTTAFRFPIQREHRVADLPLHLSLPLLRTLEHACTCPRIHLA